MGRQLLLSSILSVFCLVLPGTVASSNTTRLSLVYSGSVNGEIEPCGCPTVPLGGLERKAAFVDGLRKRQAVLLVDAGDLLFPDEAMPAPEVPQRRLKAELILKANQAMGIEALGLGDQDLALGISFLKEMAALYESPFLSANLVTRKDGRPVFPPHKIVNTAGVRIGIFSVMSPKDWRGKPIELGQQWQVRDAMEAARRQVDVLQKKKVHYIIALTSHGVDADEGLARAVPGIDLIVGSHSGTRILEPRKVQTAYIVQGGLKGERIGLLDYTLVGDPRESIRKVADTTADMDLGLDDDDDDAGPAGSAIYNEIVDLDPDIGTHATVGPMVKAAKKAISEMPPPDDVKPVALTGPFVGAAACQGCHTKEYLSWKETPHAGAYKTLIEWQRQFDYDCVGCHTTGWKKDGGFDNPWTVGTLKDVQCETCHGAGRAHAQDPEKNKLVVVPEEKLCRSCHSQEQTGDRFKIGEYLPKVSHKPKS